MKRASAMRRLGPHCAASALAGAMIFLATADFDLWPLAWLALGPFAFAVDRAPSARSAALLGWLAGTITNLGGFYWIAGLLERFGGWPMPLALLGLVAFSAYQGLVYLLVGWVVWRIRHGRPGRKLPMALLVPMTLVGFEHLVPFVFPWYLAITQAWQPLVIQIADLTGPLGVTAVVAMVGAALYDLGTARDRKQRFAIGGVGLSVLLGVLGYGAFRLHTVGAQRAAAPTLRVGLIQGNIPYDQKGVGDRRAALDQLSALQRESVAAEAEGAQLIVWSESAYPFALSRSQASDFAVGDPYRIRRGFEAPLLFGAITYDREHRAKDPYNSALLLGSDGGIRGIYDKVELLVFGEYVPLSSRFPLLREWMPTATGHYTPGAGPTTLSLEIGDRTIELGPMICYEDILPRFGRSLADHRPHLLVNLTNDAWFGDTSEPWEHMALSVFRAVESRIDMVRAVNTGVTSMITAEGRVLAELEPVDPPDGMVDSDHLVVDVAVLGGGTTLYTLAGDWLAYLCWIATLALLWRRRRRIS